MVKMADPHGVQRRRERGRRSQAAFRKRQADQDKRLKAAIAQVIASTKGNESADLLEAILGLAEAADLDHKSEALALPTALPLVRPEATMSGSVFSDNTTQSLLVPTAFQQQAKTIWLDPFALNEPSPPPQDILPYLGQGSTRFAGLILWSCMNHGMQRCHLPHSSPLEVIGRSLQHCSTSQELGAPFVLGMIEARVQYIQDGDLSTRLKVPGEIDLGEVINGRIKREYRARGEDVDRQWLTSVALEKCVGDVVGQQVLDLLERGAAGIAGGFVNGLMEGFKCRLWESCVCFGNGPRWHIDVVQELVRAVMEKAMQGRSVRTAAGQQSG